ncbi:hypothetical protein [Streptomyces sp. NPDC051662]
MKLFVIKATSHLDPVVSDRLQADGRVHIGPARREEPAAQLVECPEGTTR